MNDLLCKANDLIKLFQQLTPPVKLLYLFFEPFSGPMAAIVQLLCSVFEFKISQVFVLAALLICSGIFSIILNGKLLVACCCKSFNIAVMNVCTGISISLFGAALSLDYEDYSDGPPFKDGFTLTYDWDCVSLFTLTSFLLHLLSLKSFLICTVEQAKISASYGYRSNAPLLSLVISLFCKISSSGWLFIAALYTICEVAYRFLYGGVGTGPELYGDLKIIQDEQNLAESGITVTFLFFLPAVVAAKLLLIGKTPNSNMEFANIITALSAITFVLCLSSFFVDTLGGNFIVYYPLKSFVLNLLFQSCFCISFPLLHIYYKQCTCINKHSY